jgi:hypothetical protein
MTTKSLERARVGRVFSPRAHCGLNATGVTSNSKIFGRDIAVWVFAPEELRGPAAGGARDSS